MWNVIHSKKKKKFPVLSLILKNKSCLLAEVVADDTKSIDAVIRSDTKRTALLEEEKRLLAQSKTQSADLDRLNSVSYFINSICYFFFQFSVW